MIAPRVVSGTASQLYRVATSGLVFLEERGFTPVMVPLVYPAGGAAEGDIRFLDGEGRLWAVRSDFTPLVARALAHELETQRVVRVCYAGEVARRFRAQLKGLSSLFQLGFESFGEDGGGPGALRCALELLQHLGVPPETLVVSLGHRGLAEDLLAQLLEDEPDAELFEMLASGDVDGLVQRMGLFGESRRYLREAVFGEGEGWVRYFGVERYWRRMNEAKAKALELGVSVHLSVAPPLSAGYYRGLFFALWGRATREAVAFGGEYAAGEEDRRVPASGAALALERVVAEAR